MSSVEEELERIDILRYDDPSEALRAAKRLRAVIPRPLKSRLLGLIGSCYRSLEDLDRAREAIFLGMERAKRRQEHDAYGELSRRMAYVYLAEGELQVAWKLCREGLASHAKVLDFHGIARAAVDCGVVLFHCGDHRRSIESFGFAEKVLPVEDHRGQYAVLHGRALNLLELGQLDKAVDQLKKARKVVIPREFKVKLLWLESRVLREQRRFDESIRLLSKVADFYREARSPRNCSFASLDLIELYWRANRPAEATALAKSLAFLLIEFRGNRLAEMAIKTLVEAAAEGEINLGLVNASREAMRRAGRAQRATNDLQP